MNISRRVISILLAAMTGLSQTVLADSTKADCSMFRHGEEKPNASGACNFSQRQGNIDIKLHNGHTVSLTPMGEADHYKDKDGHRVVQTREKGDTHRYKWDDKYLVVDFNSDTSHQAGDPVRGLHDLIGMKTGKAEKEMESRGYNRRNSTQSGNNTYSNWKEHASGRCVVSRSVNGHIKSIAFSSDYDCRQ